MTSSEQPCLSVEGLAVQFSGRVVLDDTFLSVDRGELVGLLGPNGAGKTTLLRTILGLVTAARGTIRIDGQPARHGVVPLGYVPQRHEFAWDFPVNVAQVVMTGLTGRLGVLRRPNATHWAAVAAALERVRLTELTHRPVGQLSGGQRQRVLVARALASRPSVLLLDEPFTGLDMPTQALLSALFADLATEGRAVLMTTHDILGAVDACDRLVLLNQTVIATGAPAALAADPSVWMSTFSIGEDSALVRALKAA